MFVLLTITLKHWLLTNCHLCLYYEEEKIIKESSSFQETHILGKEEGWLSLEGQVVKVWGFAALTFSLTTIHLCCNSTKEATNK